MQLQLKNISMTYALESVFEKKALSDISMTIEEGLFYAIIGHTGSGKSTLIQLLNGLLKPTSGEVLLDGVNINENKKNIHLIRQKVGIVFQYPEYQLFETTIFKDVCFGPANLKLSKDEIEKCATEALKSVGIDEHLFSKSPFDLSGGQKRRVAIAGVLAMKPKILILDEPTAGLDPKGRTEILNQIKKMHEQLKISIILVSHSMEDVAFYAQKIFVLNKGNLVLEGTAKDIFKKADYLTQIGLSVPETTLLMHRLKEKGFDVNLDIFTKEDATNELLKILKKLTTVKL